MNILGVTLAYNEADCIETAMKMLLRCCDSVIVFDHGSTDDTADIVDAMPGVDRVAIDRLTCPVVDKDGRQTPLPWRFVAKALLRCQDVFDWVVWIDADEILRKPDNELPIKADIEREAQSGIQVIRPLIRKFFMTNNNGPENNYLRSLCYYKTYEIGHAPRAWQLNLTPENVPPGRHVYDTTTGPRVHPFYIPWPNGTRVSNNRWLLDHYPFRSQAQATKKILHDRVWITPLDQRRYYNHIRSNGRVDVKHSTRGLTHVDQALEMP